MSDDYRLDYPQWHPAALFEVVDGRIPDDWLVGHHEVGSEEFGVTISFPEWAGDRFYYERLVDGEPVAQAVFDRQRRALEASIRADPPESMSLVGDWVHDNADGSVSTLTLESVGVLSFETISPGLLGLPEVAGVPLPVRGTWEPQLVDVAGEPLVHFDIPPQPGVGVGVSSRLIVRFGVGWTTLTLSGTDGQDPVEFRRAAEVANRSTLAE